ncbi:MAG TPA: Hsp20/alpha crystallin family protein, partial [Myxococcaceae bacterium]
DFRVDIEDDALVLQGERRIEREETHGGVRRVERSHGSFRRIIPLPQAANLEAAEAELLRPEVYSDGRRAAEAQAGLAAATAEVDRLYARWAELTSVG